MLNCWRDNAKPARTMLNGSAVPILAEVDRETLFRSMTRVIDIAHRHGIDAVVDAMIELKGDFLRAETEAERKKRAQSA